MVKVVQGDMFRSNAQTLVNTVNCVGVMGKGVALEFKRRFPDMYRDYAERCARGEVRLGEPYIYSGGLFDPWVLNFPTKDHWRSVASLTDIERGLQYLLSRYREWGIESLAAPPLGCGQGQLEWRIVGPTLYRYLNRLEIPVELYAPYDTPHEELQTEFLAAAPDSRAPVVMPEPDFVKPAWIALVESLWRLEQEPYHWPVGRTTFQKMAYVATREGVPTGLMFQRGSYGPFAPELKAHVTRLVNNGLITEERLGRMLAVKVGPTFKDASQAYSGSISAWNAVLDRITDLFCRADSNRAEVLATVLFSEDQLRKASDRVPTERDVFEYVKQWKVRRKPPIDDYEIADTIRNLAALGWISVQPSPESPLPDDEAFVIA
jgi:O-acetyl-ADP-ribose deacetylase (regulator of RNase III)/uncharacterized protein YwgA